MPIYIVGEGPERFWNGMMGDEQNVGWTGWAMDGYWIDTPQTVMTTRAPTVLIKGFDPCSLGILVLYFKGKQM